MYSMLGLVRDANASITGSVRFEGKEILGLADRDMQSIRGGDIGMIFQDPMTALRRSTPVGMANRRTDSRAHGHDQSAGEGACHRTVGRGGDP